MMDQKDLAWKNSPLHHDGSPLKKTVRKWKLSPEIERIYKNRSCIQFSLPTVIEVMRSYGYGSIPMKIPFLGE